MLSTSASPWHTCPEERLASELAMLAAELCILASRLYTGSAGSQRAAAFLLLAAVLNCFAMSQSWLSVDLASEEPKLIACMCSGHRRLFPLTFRYSPRGMIACCCS